jgi:VanZ family protein
MASRAMGEGARMLRARQPILLAWGLTLAFAIAIIGMTLTPPSGAAGLWAVNDKLAHALGFAVLVLPMAVLHPRGLWTVIPMALALGATIEVVQPMVGRGRELADLLADAAGIVAGTAAGLALHRLRRR